MRIKTFKRGTFSYSSATAHRFSLVSAPCSIWVGHPFWALINARDWSSILSGRLGRVLVSTWARNVSARRRILSIGVCRSCCDLALVSRYLVYLWRLDLRLDLWLWLWNRSRLRWNLVVSDCLAEWLRWRHWIVILLLNSDILTSIYVRWLRGWSCVGHSLGKLMNWRRNHALVNDLPLLLRRVLTFTRVDKFLG